MTKQKPKSELDGIELHPDAWERFEGFVKTSVRTAQAPSKKPAARAKPAKRKARKAS